MSWSQNGMVGPRGEDPLPDVFEPIVGYRQFFAVKKPNGWVLRSPIKGTEWEKSTMRAQCFYVDAAVYSNSTGPRTIVDKHRAPNHDCGCGIYAYYEPAALHTKGAWLLWSDFGSKFRVTCVITLTGAVEVHSRGMRGEKASIKAIMWDPLQKEPVMAIANTYNLDIIDEADIYDKALKYGKPLDKSLRPQQHIEGGNDVSK